MYITDRAGVQHIVKGIGLVIKPWAWPCISIASKTRINMNTHKVVGVAHGNAISMVILWRPM